MKKKVVSVLLAAVLTMSMMACGAAEETAPAPAETASADEAAPAGTPEETADTAEASAADVNATVIWRAFDDQFQSGFRIIMQNEQEVIGGVSLDMQDAANDVSTAISKLEAALTKGTDVVAICAPDRESTETMAQKCDEEGVPAVFFNMEPMETTMQTYENIYYVGAQAKESGQQDVVLRTQAYEETLKAQGIKYEVLAMDTANWDQAQALDKMNAWITAYGIDGIEGVLCNNNNMAMGAVQACNLVKIFIL